MQHVQGTRDGISMNLFGQLAKYDEKTGYFEAIAADETPDRSGEVFDYTKSKPHFEAWSSDIAKATDGRSVGNLRVMHGNAVAGKLTGLTFDDDARSIKVAGLVVDENEKKKFAAGCYTGVSIGGKYVGDTWPDSVNKNLKRYEAIPYEISIVDLPCNPNARFTVIKADNSQEMRKFAVSIADDEALVKWLDEHAEVIAKVQRRDDVNPKEGEHKYGDVKFADEKNKKYPIDTPAHIRAAWNYINKPKNADKYDSKDLKTVKSRIIAAWKDKIDKNGPPSADAKKCDARSDSRAAGLLAKIDQAEPLLRTVRAAYGKEPLAKDLWSVGQLADLVSNLDCITRCAESEADWEGDNSAVPGELRGVVKELAGILIDMADEEVEELVSAYEKADLDGDLHKVAPTEGNDVMSNDLQKSLDDTKAELTKAAADLAVATLSIAKVTGERDELAKAVKERDDMLVKAAERIDALNALVEKLKAEPAPIKAALRAVSKGQDVIDPAANEIEPVRKADGSVDEVRTALKKALSEPVMVR